MPQFYCPACQLETQHKVVMRRSKTNENEGLGLWLTSLLSGKGSYQLEQQVNCRECNHQSTSQLIEQGMRRKEKGEQHVQANLV